MNRKPRAPRWLLAATAAAWLAVAPATADEAPGGEPFRATSHRRFDDVERWQAVFDDPSRAAWQKPAETVRAMGLREGMRVADVGAGTGYFSAELSRAVGPAGAVFSVEVEPDLVEHLRDRAETEKTANVIPVLGSREDPRLPAGLIDVVLFVDTFHHVDGRLGYFRRLQRALAPGGRVIVIDFREGELPVGPPPDHKLPERQVVAEMKAAGYRLIASPGLLPYQYFLIFAAEPG